MLDRILFKSKHWQLFLVAAIGFVTIHLYPIQTDFQFHLTKLLPGELFVIYLLVLGIRLRKFLPDYYQLHFVLFIISAIVLEVFPIITLIYRKETVETQLPWWGILIIIIVALALIIAFFGFIARAVKSLQTHDRSRMNDYASDVFLWGMWYIGVWYLQPRLNLLYDQYFADLQEPVEAGLPTRD
jgi:hypothetical protein